jgi:hypothetical protein
MVLIMNKGINVKEEDIWVSKSEGYMFMYMLMIEIDKYIDKDRSNK